MLAGIRFFTAREMQAKVKQLTGFFHPDFVTYERILGVQDSDSGRRIPEIISPAGVLALRAIASRVSQKVIQREVFLAAAERLVFKDMDLSRPISSIDLARFLERSSEEWFEFGIDPDSQESLFERFFDMQAKHGELDACTDLLATLIQHPGVYIY